MDRTVDFDLQHRAQGGCLLRPIDSNSRIDASKVIAWTQTTGLSPALLNHPNNTSELTASNDSHTRTTGRNHTGLIRQESLKLSQSAPNLETLHQRTSPLTPEEYSARFINENLKLFEFYHNLASNGQLDLSAEFTESNDDAVLFERENEDMQLNEKAIDFLKNFSTHQYFHQYQQPIDETNGKL